jgi:hypothetical protein
VPWVPIDSVAVRVARAGSAAGPFSSPVRVLPCRVGCLVRRPSLADHFNVSEYKAGGFVGAAITYYCPEQMPPAQGGG